MGGWVRIGEPVGKRAMDEANCDGDRRWHGGTMFAQKEGRRACAEPRNVIWKGGDEEADGETTRSESLDGWNKFQLLATGRETRVSWRRRRGGGMDAKKVMGG